MAFGPGSRRRTPRKTSRAGLSIGLSCPARGKVAPSLAFGHGFAKERFGRFEAAGFEEERSELPLRDARDLARDDAVAEARDGAVHGFERGGPLAAL